MHILDIVPDRSQRELGAVTLALFIAIHIGHRTCTPIRASQAVQAHNKEPCHVECSSIPSHQWTPPISHIGAPRQSVADDQGVFAVCGESPSSGICNRDIAKGSSRFECEKWYYSDVLIWNESSKRVLRLAGGFLCGI